MAHPLEIKRAMETAAAHHRAGRLREAEEIYRQVLAAEPNHAMAIGLLGVIAHQTGHCVDAEALLTRALRLVQGFDPIGLGIGRPERRLAIRPRPGQCSRRPD